MTKQDMKFLASEGYIRETVAGCILTPKTRRSLETGDKLGADVWHRDRNPRHVF